MVTLFLHSRGILFLFSSYCNLNKVSILLFFKIFHSNHKWSSKHLELLKNLKSKHGKHTCPGETWQCENTSKAIQPYFRLFSYILMIATRIAAVPLAKAIRVMIMLKISGVLPILLIRRSRDITVNWIRSIDSTLTIEVSLFSTAYKKAGSKTQAIAITNRLLPVSSPLFTTEIMRRFDAMINVEQMIKKDFLFI